MTFRDSKLNRRGFLQAGLGVGIGLALWNLFKEASDNRIARNLASTMLFEKAGIDGEMLTRLLELALSSGGQYADIFLELSVTGQTRYERGQVRTAGAKSVAGAAVRIISGGHAILRVTDNVSWDGLARAAREVAAARRSGEAATIPSMRKAKSHDLYSVASQSVDEPLESKRLLLERATESAFAVDPRIRAASAKYTDNIRFITVATSDGIFAQDLQPLIKLSVSATALSGNDTAGEGTAAGGGHYGLEYFDQYSPESVGERAAAIAVHQLAGRPARLGRLPLVLGPGQSGLLIHEAVGHGLEADVNLTGYSVYSGRIGEVIASPHCTVIDQGCIRNINGSINFDDEATSSSKTTLIDGGRLTSYLHSRETAAAMKVKATGNGRRQDFCYHPQPRMTNTYLDVGPYSPDEIIGSVEYGIYARSLLGGTATITNGDFTFVPQEAFLIESGQITAPVSQLVFMGNGPEVLRSLSMVGNDLKMSDDLWSCGKNGQLVPVTVGTPTVRVDSIVAG